MENMIENLQDEAFVNKFIVHVQDLKRASGIGDEKINIYVEKKNEGLSELLLANTDHICRQTNADSILFQDEIEDGLKVSYNDEEIKLKLVKTKENKPVDRVYRFFLLALSMIILDQVVKMLVHFNMTLGMSGQIKLIGDWFKLHYTLNPGMAFGIELGSEYGKLILTLFRLVAVVVIAFYIIKLAKKGAHPGLLYCIALILGGAIGNVLDSTFYGVLLNNAPYDAVTPWFHGQVIDMFYIDIWEGVLPEWLPLLGGKYYAFWPIFNIADASIFVGISLILIFQKRFFIN